MNWNNCSSSRWPTAQQFQVKMRYRFEQDKEVDLYQYCTKKWKHDSILVRHGHPPRFSGSIKVLSINRFIHKLAFVERLSMFSVSL